MGLLGVRTLSELTPELLCDIVPAPRTDWIGFSRRPDRLDAPLPNGDRPGP